jgi:hypothetical protein
VLATVLILCYNSRNNLLGIDIMNKRILELIKKNESLFKNIEMWIPLISMVIVAAAPVIGWSALGSSHGYQLDWQVLGAISGTTIGIVGAIILSCIRITISHKLEESTGATTKAAPA